MHSESAPCCQPHVTGRFKDKVMLNDGLDMHQHISSCNPGHQLDKQ